MKCMNLVMDDFYHAHAHSLRPLCIEGCGDLVANSYVGDCALTRTRNTEKKRTGDVTRTITSNVNESIENGSVTINNNLMGKTVTEMMPAGDYKTEVTAMNYETMFMVNGEHKVMDVSTKKTVIDLGITDLVFDSPRSTTDANIVSETFLGGRLINNFGLHYERFVGARHVAAFGILSSKDVGRIMKTEAEIKDSKTLINKTKNAALFSAACVILC